MYKMIVAFLDLLTAREKKQLFWLFVAILLMALFEMVGIASIMPFMAVVANPAVIETNFWLKLVYDALHFNDKREFLVFLGFGVFVVLVFNNCFKAVIVWLTLRYDNNLYYTLSQRLLNKYLLRSYVFYLNRNTTELGKNVLNEVRNVIIGVLSPGVQVLSGGLIILCIFVLLMIVDPGIALTIAAILGGGYACAYLAARHRLAVIGREQVEANAMKFKVAGEALSGIKDLKVLGREDYFLDLFSVHAKRHADNNVRAGVIAQLPRYALEILAFGGILAIVLYFLRTGQNVEKLVPVMALYAFAGYRLMPALQQIFAGVASLRANMAVLDLLHRDMGVASLAMDEPPMATDHMEVEPLAFTREMHLEGVGFQYPGAREPVLRDIDLTIAANTTVAFVGATGSGKTTMVDLILGLLTPASGHMFVDGCEITGPTLARWQRNLGYVPQSIFLTDDTLMRNIAFGVPDAEIDREAVFRAARIANLSAFVEQELPDKYDTIIGERGVRLSGGQRQRIGIARALYRDPAVLVLDEATSALDGLTEEAVMDAIRTLSRKKTIILVAHRLSTVRDCDVIYLLEQGRVVAQGNYATLQEESQWFRTVAQSVQ